MLTPLQKLNRTKALLGDDKYCTCKECWGGIYMSHAGLALSGHGPVAAEAIATSSPHAR